MKVTITADGEVSFDIETVEEALKVARALKNEDSALTGKALDAPVVKASDPVFQGDGHAVNAHGWRPPVVVEPVDDGLSDVCLDLGDRMYETWRFLCDHENVPGGIKIDAVARHFKIKKSAAGQRLSQLVVKGYAKRVSVGRYEWSLP